MSQHSEGNQDEPIDPWFIPTAAPQSPDFLEDLLHRESLYLPLELNLEGVNPDDYHGRRVFGPMQHAEITIPATVEESTESQAARLPSWFHINLEEHQEFEIARGGHEIGTLRQIHEHVQHNVSSEYFQLAPVPVLQPTFGPLYDPSFCSPTATYYDHENHRWMIQQPGNYPSSYGLIGFAHHELGFNLRLDSVTPVMLSPEQQEAEFNLYAASATITAANDFGPSDHSEDPSEQGSWYSHLIPTFEDSVQSADEYAVNEQDQAQQNIHVNS